MPLRAGMVVLKGPGTLVPGDQAWQEPREVRHRCMRRDPVIVPFYHSGMARVMPEHGRIPRVGQTVAVTVGEPIDVSDLTCQCHKGGNTQVLSTALKGCGHRCALHCFECKRPHISTDFAWGRPGQKIFRQGKIPS